MTYDGDLLLAAIDAASRTAYGSVANDEIGERRAAVLEAYLGYNTNPAPEGRSQVVDRSVYETVHTVLPQLVRIFAGSSDQICKFVPIGPEDEAGAEQTTAVVNHLVANSNQWEQVISDWILDALLSPTSYCLVYWDDTERVVREEYTGQSDDQMAALLQDQSVTVVRHSEYVDEQMTADLMRSHDQAVQQVRAQGGDPASLPAPRPVMLHDLMIERREQQGRLCVRVLPPERCRVSQDTPDWTLKYCPYFEYREEKTIAELRFMGLDVPDDINDDEDDIDGTPEDLARDRFDEYAADADGQTGAARRVWTRMIWVQADGDDTGLVQTWYVLAVGRTILHAEPTSGIQVASMTCQPMPHRHPGISLAESVLDIQSIKTAVKRGALDNLYLANNSRWVVSSRVNLDDMLNARPGGIVRMLDESLPSEGHVMPMTTPLAFDSIIGALEYFDVERQNRSGAMRGAAGLEANALNKAAVGTTIAMQSATSMRIEHIARMMAPAVERLFEIAHELISKHGNKPLTIKLRGSWVTVDPQEWRTKRDCRISVGLGAGNREAMQQHLAHMFAAQMQLLPLGVAQPRHLYETVIEMAKLAGFSNPARFWMDPATSPPMPNQVPPEVQREQMRLQAEAQRIQYEAQQEQLKFQAQTQLERERMQMQMQVDREREEMQARQKALEAQQRAELDAQKAAMQARQSEQDRELEKWKAELDASVRLQVAQMQARPDVDARLGELIGVLRELENEMKSPVEIVRGPDGKAVGVKRGGKVRQIVRDPQTGRAVGIN